MTTTAFETLVAESEKVGWPEHYTDDLHKHDRRFLAERQPAEFVWVLRQCGTFTVLGWDDVAESIMKTFTDETARFYLWRGYLKRDRFLQVDRERAIKALKKMEKDIEARSRVPGSATEQLS